MLVLGLAACNKERAAENINSPADQAMENVSGALNDMAITKNVKAAILKEPNLRVLRIRVETMNGVTILSGSVDSQQHSDGAMESASAATGVNAVENQLVVKANIESEL